MGEAFSDIQRLLLYVTMRVFFFFFAYVFHMTHSNKMNVLRT